MAKKKKEETEGNWLVIICIVGLILLSGLGSYFKHIERKEIRKILTEIVTQNTAILAHISCPPPYDVFYDVGADRPKESRTHNVRNSRLIPGATND